MGDHCRGRAAIALDDGKCNLIIVIIAYPLKSSSTSAVISLGKPPQRQISGAIALYSTGSHQPGRPEAKYRAARSSQ
jgi:hypothetical protein